MVLLGIAILTIPVFANPDATVIRVVPVGEPHTGSAIITGNPATLEAFVTTAAHSPIYDVWLLVVIDHDTYMNMNSITISDTDYPVTLVPGDFSAAVTGSPDKIPLTNDGNYSGPTAFPGCQQNIQYAYGAVISQMSQVHTTTTIHYVLVYAFNSITNAPSRVFTVATDSTHINVLILGLGTEEDGTILANNTPFSGSTLHTPQIASILLAIASFSALAIYAVKRKRNK
jgi:hypothetical protein